MFPHAQFIQSNIRSKHAIMGVITIILLAWQLCTTATAHAFADTVDRYEQSATCRSTVVSGWSPYRLQAGDTLETLALRSGVSVEELMQVNCLQSEEVAAGALLLMPKLGPLPPTPTPTSIPTPTAVPTITPITEEITTTQESAVEDPSDAASQKDTDKSTAGTMNGTTAVLTIISETVPSAIPLEVDNNSELTTTAEVSTTLTATATAVAQETPNIGGSVDGGGSTPSAPLSSNNLITLAIIITGAVGALFFALQPRRRVAAEATSDMSLTAEATTGAEASGAGFGWNLLFLIGGFAVGVYLFPLIQLPMLLELPTWLSAGAALGLILLLAVKEVMLSAVQWRGLNRALNFGIAPLLMIFFLSVVTRFADVIR